MEGLTDQKIKKIEQKQMIKQSYRINKDLMTINLEFHLDLIEVQDKEKDQKDYLMGHMVHMEGQDKEKDKWDYLIDKDQEKEI